MRKRERFVIIHDILRAIQNRQNKAKPTHILYKSNLSSQMLKEYLSDLIKKDFIEENHSSGSKTYSLKDKGYKYLQDFSTIKAFIESYGLDE